MLRDVIGFGFSELVLAALAAAAWGGIVWAAFGVWDRAKQDFRKSYRVEGEPAAEDVWSTLTPARLNEVGTVAAAVGFLLGLLAVNAAAGALLAAGGFLLPRLFLGVAQENRRARFHTQLLDGLGLLSNSVRAGMTLPQAIELLVRELKPPITHEFGRVLQEYQLGADFDGSMLAMAERLESRDMNMLVNAVGITRRSGGNVGEVFQKIAAGIRERGRVEGKVRALAATGKMQAVVMAGMPFGIVLILYFMEPDHVQLLFSTPMGLAAVGVVVALQVVAFLWIRSLTALDV